MAPKDAANDARMMALETARAAVDLVAQANTTLAAAGHGVAVATDPLDRVNTGVFSLGDLNPVLDDAQVQALRERLRTDELPADLAIKVFQGVRLLAAALVG
jgi:hypothetical protein